jgi:tryptophan synthase alpha subunit
VVQVFSSALSPQLVLTVYLDVIEVGLPFTDPIADGPTVQKANTVRIQAPI